MKDKRFTLMYLDGEEMNPIPHADGYDTIDEAKQWCDENGISYDVMSITEWDLFTLAGDGLPEIVAVVSFGAVIMDGVEDLFRYQMY
jgi:hypothetical protein